MNGAQVRSITAHRPQRTVLNADLPSHLETSDEWIRTRTGIESRGLAAQDETLLDMCCGAAEKAIADSGVDPQTVDLVLVGSTTNPQQTPGIAPQLTHRLGLTAGAVDVAAACAGFCYTLGLAADSVRVGTSRNALIIGAERLSDRMDWNDRNTCYLFGDGAGAAIISPTTVERNSVWKPAWGADGSLATAIEVPLGSKYLSMDGQAVFRWAITEIVRVAHEACANAGITPQDLDAFIPHQANLRIVESVARSLDLKPSTVVADDIRISGNTSAASIPLAIARMKEQGKLQPGDLTLMIGFGAGMSWAGQVIRCP